MRAPGWFVPVVLCSTLAGAQAPRKLTLGPATASLSEEFTQLHSAFELPDGRLILTEFTEQRMVVADLKQNTVRTIGSRGDGPGEYSRVTDLYPFGPDSTVMVLALARRWNVITRDLKFSTISQDAELIRLVGANYFAGSDALGRVMVHGMPRRAPGITRDTSPLILISWRTVKRVDTIGRYDGGEAPGQPRSGPERLPAFALYDQAVLGPDGSVAIVRHKPYRVEWRSPEGRWTIGKVVADPPVRVTEAEKKAFHDRRAAARANATSRIILSPGVGAKSGTGPPRPMPEFAFPDEIPPMMASFKPLISASGTLLVRRNPTVAAPTPLFDVFDRRGNRVAQLSLPDNQRPIAVGKSSIYIVTTDDDGIQRVSRHAWPVSR